MKEEKVISVLIGLIGACSNNPKTENTDDLVIRSLALPIIRPDFNDNDISELVNEIRAEKNAVAPGCATCASPCGNTSDYDMDRIYQAENGICQLKLQILSKIQKLAAHEYLSRQSGASTETNAGFFCKSLSFISYDLEKERLLDLLNETEIMENKIGDN